MISCLAISAGNTTCKTFKWPLGLTPAIASKKIDLPANQKPALFCPPITTNNISLIELRSKILPKRTSRTAWAKKWLPIQSDRLCCERNHRQLKTVIPQLQDIKISQMKRQRCQSDSFQKRKNKFIFMRSNITVTRTLIAPCNLPNKRKAGIIDKIKQ